MTGSMLPFILTPLPSYSMAFHVDVAAWMSVLTLSLLFLVATIAFYKLDMLLLLLLSFGQ